MCAALQLVLACVALARVLPARCHDATLLETPQATPQCGEHSPDIYVFIIDDANGSGYKEKNLNKTFIPYGKSFKVECVGADVMKKGAMRLQTETWNKKILEWRVKKPDLHESVYMCIDSATTCQRSTVISVTPAFDVISSNVTDLKNEYIKQYDGNPITVLCSGPAAARLDMTMNGRELLTSPVNKTTIKWFMNEPDLQISEFVCTDRDTAIHRRVQLKVFPLLIITSEYWHPYDYIIQHDSILPFGDSIEVFCSGPRAVKLINVEEDNEETTTKTGNNMLQYTKIIKFDKDIELGCVDKIYLDYMRIVKLRVTPRIDVISPGVRRTGKRSYDVKYGDPIAIVCSWPDAERTLKCDEPITLGRKTVNGSTTTWIIKIPDGIFRRMYCSCSTKSIVSKKMTINVRVIRLPKAVGFHCVSHKQQYKCTWTSFSYYTNFALSYAKDNEISKPVCTKTLDHEYTDSVFCLWDDINYQSHSSDVKMVSFQMQSCNDHGCSNETFVIDYCSILKIAPPQDLEVVKTSSRGVELIWYTNSIKCGGESLSAVSDVHYKVEYWYSGVQRIEVNSSVVSCYPRYCTIKVNLPCPGQSYRVWVYHKLKKAIGEVFWSDPTSVTFLTDDKADKVDNVNTACVPKPKETEDVLIYFVQKLRQEVLLEKPHWRKYVNSLKGKRAKIDAYRVRTDLR